MKKYLLFPVLLLALFSNAALVFAYTNTELITECAEKEGWTYGQMDDYPTAGDPGEDPIGYYNTFFKIMHCYRNEQWNDTTAVFWVPSGWFDRRSIGSFARSIGFPTNSSGYFKCFDTDECRVKDRACYTACGDDDGPSDPCGRQCVKKNMECGNELSIRCEGELEAYAKAYASKLSPVNKEPECGSFEYFVSGRCQHIFELCGRDSLFHYDPATGVCSCPDTYVPKDGKCMSEYDLDPPDIFDEQPPPPSEPPVGDTPPKIYTPPDDDFSPDDPRNAFCQPPDGALSLQDDSSNGFIENAHAQIYSNYSVVTEISGEVLVWSQRTQQWAPAFKGQRLMVEDKIKTGRNGRCAMKFANSSEIRLRPLSQMEIMGPSHPCWCTFNMKRGYLDMKFGRVWSKDKPNDPCAQYIKTPTAIAGGSERGRPMYDYYDNDEFEVAYEILEIPLASAEDGETILHALHDEETQISKFYVEKGEVFVSDVGETVSVPISAGEQITVEPDALPHDMDIEPVAQVSGQWWEDWEDDSGMSIFVPIVLYILGIVFVIRRVWKSKRGIFMKIGMFILGFIIMNVITAILMMFV